MIQRFIHALAESSHATGLPLQSPIIGMDIRKRLQLETIAFGFMVHGPHLICIKTSIDENAGVWKLLSETRVTELHHMPSVALAIGTEDLKTAKPESGSVAS